jgi:sulfatase maturation enzyme AslB (radical SAM superfamily)
MSRKRIIIFSENSDTLKRNDKGNPSYDKTVKNINLLCEKVEKFYLTLRVNYDNRTLKLKK